MGKLSVFNFMTLNGFYKGPQGDISWHKHDAQGSEEREYAEEGAQSESTLLFGRITYEMMAAYWPSPMALEQNPGVAKGMNASAKIVVSKTLDKVNWENTTLLKGDLSEEIGRLKKAGKTITILGSGTIVTQLAEAGLIDEYQFMVNPIAMGDGTPIFKGIGHKLELELVKTRTFKSGAVLLVYQPKKR